MNPADGRLPGVLLDLALVPVDRPLPLVLEQVAGLATETLGGQPAVSVTVVGGDGAGTVGTSAQVAADLDTVQYRAGRGPCLDAATSGTVQVLPDAASERRWPELARAAVTADRRGLVSAGFPAGRAVPGGLNLYLQPPLRSDAALRERAVRFATHAAVTVGNAVLYARTAQLAEHLQVALDSRAVIDQAKGVLMERYRLTAAQAFDALTRVSNQSNTKVRDVAAHVVETGQFPPA
ncbi:Two-component response regulator, AmiR/NasT family, consists of REC and RNA-binding antiterminator (ANTAR) domains [Geodermatophilus telluris]|uniref:Two-component response regulator, AmiR/NasT family, consists of REC and RNA-binding antiterminator (ANTAR) domains n=1 Tax=Geodermatophilus telluris TaxID=1190417 RepID=A0A1G6VBX4_9ACTN|nr:GAF and ANTAR domain-containing protein [Geodermatophilus telluris]SDD51149.1 Two-component response regulator, AmiR/NasT family, consists of REC and RNA-binding antiterminator (ANTAR) domains [Geodermatophilus telluris]